MRRAPPSLVVMPMAARVLARGVRVCGGAAQDAAHLPGHRADGDVPLQRAGDVGVGVVAGQPLEDVDQPVVAVDEAAHALQHRRAVFADAQARRFVGRGRLEVEGDAVDGTLDAVGGAGDGKAVDHRLGIPGRGDHAQVRGGQLAKLARGVAHAHADRILGASVAAGQDQARTVGVVDDAGRHAAVVASAVDGVANAGQGVVGFVDDDAEGALADGEGQGAGADLGTGRREGLAGALVGLGQGAHFHAEHARRGVLARAGGKDVLVTADRLARAQAAPAL